MIFIKFLSLVFFLWLGIFNTSNDEMSTIRDYVGGEDELLSGDSYDNVIKSDSEFKKKKNKKYKEKENKYNQAKKNKKKGEKYKYKTKSVKKNQNK